MTWRRTRLWAWLRDSEEQRMDAFHKASIQATGISTALGGFQQQMRNRPRVRREEQIRICQRLRSRQAGTAAWLASKTNPSRMVRRVHRRAKRRVRGENRFFRLEREKHAQRRQAHVMVVTIVVSTTVGTGKFTFAQRARTLTRSSQTHVDQTSGPGWRLPDDKESFPCAFNPTEN